MTIDSGTLSSRRVLLTAALGAGVAAIASAIGRPLPVNAADGQAVEVGGEYVATSVTRFATITNNTTALSGTSATGHGVHATSTSSVGVQGNSTSYIGVYGSTQTGTGVYGASTSGKGVEGHSTSNIGINGASSATAKPAILGQSVGNSTGVQGYSGNSGVPAAPARTGVYGSAAQDATAMGVYGYSTVGRGVQGVATTGWGVRAHAVTGVGVVATSGSGTAILAKTDSPKAGTALQAIGRVRFDNSVGIATVASGTSSITVTPGIDLTATSAVVATLQGGAAGTFVERVSVNATAGTFTIYLNKNSTAAVKVAWHVFG